MKFQPAIESNSTIVELINFCGEVIMDYLMMNKIQISGIGVVVEINECILVKSKINRQTVGPRTIDFGFYEVESN